MTPEDLYKILNISDSTQTNVQRKKTLANASLEGKVLNYNFAIRNIEENRIWIEDNNDEYGIIFYVEYESALKEKLLTYSRGDCVCTKCSIKSTYIDSYKCSITLNLVDIWLAPIPKKISSLPVPDPSNDNPKLIASPIWLVFFTLLVLFVFFYYLGNRKENKNDHGTTNNSSISSDERVFAFVEHKPEFAGGEKGLKDFINKTMIYPIDSHKKDKNGNVYVTFIIEKDGRLTNIRVLRRLGKGFDEEALRIVRSMPNWIPGSQNGLPKRVQYNLPIRFY